ncbi:hypothetical protein [Streptomyces sp. NPDC058653]|uniref:hypothetical protein n=1 Tax=Streptomyces sp. NPDC058653 TaxID=3346576 RepID=UPI003658DDE2
MRRPHGQNEETASGFWLRRAADYVGKTLNFKTRLGDQLDSGRLKILDDVKCTHVCGTGGDVFIAEYLRVEELKRQGFGWATITSPGKKKLQQRGVQKLELW